MKLVIDFVLITGILLNAFVLFGLLRLKHRKLPQQLLIVFWVFVLINILHSYTALHNLRYLNRTTFIFEDGSRIFIAPLIYLYIKSLFFSHEHFIKRNSVHFIPFLLYFLSYTLPRLVNIWSDLDVFGHISQIHRYVNLALVKDLYFMAYCVLSIRLFYRVKGSMKRHYSDIKEKDFAWLEVFLLSLTAVIAVDLVITLSEIFFGYNVLWDDFITLTFLIIAMGYLGYNGLRQSTIFLPYFLLEKQPKQQYPISASSESARALRSKIETLLTDEKIYLIPDLTLGNLAEQIDLSERKLSAFLNDTMHVSFYDLINGHRIAEAKRRLGSEEYKKYTMEGIGHSCGFKSRSSFFRSFKKATGVSPATYQKTRLH